MARSAILYSVFRCNSISSPTSGVTAAVVLSNLDDEVRHSVKK